MPVIFRRMREVGTKKTPQIQRLEGFKPKLSVKTDIMKPMQS